MCRIQHFRFGCFVRSFLFCVFSYFRTLLFRFSRFRLPTSAFLCVGFLIFVLYLPAERRWLRFWCVFELVFELFLEFIDCKQGYFKLLVLFLLPLKSYYFVFSPLRFVFFYVYWKFFICKTLHFSFCLFSSCRFLLFRFVTFLETHYLVLYMNKFSTFYAYHQSGQHEYWTKAIITWLIMEVEHPLFTFCVISTCRIIPKFFFGCFIRVGTNFFILCVFFV